MVVMPDQWRSFQKRFEGCAYAKPVVPVIMPGFTPTRSRVRFSGIVSLRREVGREEGEDVLRWRVPEREPGRRSGVLGRAGVEVDSELDV